MLVWCSRNEVCMSVGGKASLCGKWSLVLVLMTMCTGAAEQGLFPGNVPHRTYPGRRIVIEYIFVILCINIFLQTYKLASFESLSWVSQCLYRATSAWSGRTCPCIRAPASLHRFVLFLSPFETGFHSVAPADFSWFVAVHLSLHWD